MWVVGPSTLGLLKYSFIFLRPKTLAKVVLVAHLNCLLCTKPQITKVFGEV